ncbi:hypothetical protein [Pontibacillus salipaludis]|uniref:hypothetical protein n=1 Tax=Pontibacillus salipaludis TaxID=1697394 RepID=UPI0031E51A9F
MKKGLDGLRKPGGRPKGNKSEVFSQENGNIEVMSSQEKPDKDVQLGKMDMASSVVDTVGDVVSQVSRSIENVKLASMELDKIRETSRRDVKVAKESTKTTKIEEREKTKRFVQETEKEIREIEKESTKLANTHMETMKKQDQEHERRMKQLQMAEDHLGQLSDHLQVLMDKVKQCHAEGIEVPEELTLQIQEHSKVLTERTIQLQQS